MGRDRRLEPVKPPERTLINYFHSRTYNESMVYIVVRVDVESRRYM